MAGPVIAVDTGVSQAKKSLWPGRVRLGTPPRATEFEDRSYASPESLFMDQYEPLARAITLMTHDADIARDAVQEASPVSATNGPRCPAIATRRPGCARWPSIWSAISNEGRAGRGTCSVWIRTPWSSWSSYPTSREPRATPSCGEPLRASREAEDRRRSFLHRRLEHRRGGRGHGHLARNRQPPPQPSPKHSANEGGA